MAASAQEKSPVTAWPDLGIAPGPVLRVFGMRRSGNHAIINWLARNAPGGKSVFFNNCAIGRKPFQTFRAVEINGRRRPGSASDDPAQFAGRAGDGACVIFSYEDAMPDAARKRPVSIGVDENAITHEVIIYRSFLNWAASLTKKVQGNPGYQGHQRVAIVLRALATYSSMLDLVGGAKALGVVPICYDRWYGETAYRAGILGNLGFEARDDTLGDVQAYGNGSSFQADADKAEDLRPESRWREMDGDAEYRMVLWLAAQDTELCTKLSQVFPDDAAQLDQMCQTPPIALKEGMS